MYFVAVDDGINGAAANRHHSSAASMIVDLLCGC
jgi:hypothetical protein